MLRESKVRIKREVVIHTVARLTSLLCEEWPAEMIVNDLTIHQLIRRIRPWDDFWKQLLYTFFLSAGKSVYKHARTLIPFVVRPLKCFWCHDIHSNCTPTHLASHFLLPISRLMPICLTQTLKFHPVISQFYLATEVVDFICIQLRVNRCGHVRRRLHIGHSAQILGWKSV